MKTIKLVLVLALGACSSTSGNAQQDAPPTPADAAMRDASCFDLGGVANPTHYQIINGCTTADKIFKASKPPLVNPDGSLPPLPP
jgi:hypothetical protein